MRGVLGPNYFEFDGSQNGSARGVKKVKKGPIWIKAVLMILGVSLELFYLGAIFSSSMTAPYTGPSNSLLPLMTFPFVCVGAFRPRLGGVFLILLSLVSALVSFLTTYDWYRKSVLNFGTVVSEIKYFGPIMVVGLCFLMIGIFEKRRKG
jgi:hypothetical protein